MQQAYGILATLFELTIFAGGAALLIVTACMLL
jgi:hypothetical protein